MSVQKEIELIYSRNPQITALLNNNQKFLYSAVESMNERGLYYIDNDYYVYNGKGGLKIHETPKGVKKSICDIAKKYSLSVIIISGVICQGDEINVSSNGTIDEVEIKKSTQTLINGGEILAPYAVVTVYKDNTMISKKLFIVPNDEYKKIVAMGRGNAFKTLMAEKSVMKRVANGIYALLGVTLDRKDAKVIDDMGEAMRVDNEETKVVEKIDTMEELKKVKDSVDMLDVESLIASKKRLIELYSTELDKEKREKIKAFGKEITETLKNLGGQK
jgi:hypothetical protein